MGKLGLECERAINGLEALEKYSIAPSAYFLVLMDMNMPVRSFFSSLPILVTANKVSQIMDGFEATEKIRAVERSNKFRHVHIAALTGVTSSEARARASNAGVDEYITKPIRMKDLTAIIDGVRNEMSKT
jgi:CheY-like chemotaxis protein